MSSWSRPLLVLSLLLAPASLVRGDAFGVTLQLPTRMPAWAEPLSPHLASLSIEMDRWTDWAGAEIGRPNDLTLSNLALLWHDPDALLIVNEAIGKGNNSYVAELSASNDTLAAYGIWEGNTLRRVVALNSNVHLGDSTASSFNITLNEEGAKRVSWIKRLAAPATTASSGVTWAGQSFETLSGLPEGQVTLEEVDNGMFEIQPSTAILLEFE
ncbi:hypothetical protein INS49_002104 [Diaporthe citri]|uniref:uncharacterized protein n=1 Tax=Diaporthe citri TaxID=83186 RepID=UPI001C7EBB81|nr:uncharacterized protein INS49_002104 [Diaporthe citri]KAG6367905.1 hypothetical protein INS49_002104 [Diaporthe citri]